jgi:hypothetical protein
MKKKGEDDNEPFVHRHFLVMNEKKKKKDDNILCCSK